MTEAALSPAGFRELPMIDAAGFNGICGPLWVKDEAGKLIAGFRVETRHCNPGGTCHGGMLATFSDVHLAVAAQYETAIKALILPTITLQMDYLAPTPLGAWVDARPEIYKVTRGMVFAQETILADGEPVAFARGIFKIPRLPEGIDPADMPNTGARLREFLRSWA